MAKQSVNASRVSSSLIAMEFLVPEEIEFIEVADNGLFEWEFVNVRDGLEFGYVDEEDEDDDIEERMRKEFDSWDSSISLSMLPNEVDPPIHLDVGMKEDNHLDDEDDGANGGSRQSDDVDLSIENCPYQLHQYDHLGEGYGDDDGGDGYGDDEHDLNDELVPWSVSSKFGRQRMRKLGKRAFPKMNHSKRSPYLYMKPGCVRGKHGLGLKHSC